MQHAALHAVSTTLDVDVTAKNERLQGVLRARLGDNIYEAWFRTIAVDRFDGRCVHASVATKFLRSWINERYADVLLKCFEDVFPGTEKFELTERIHEQRIVQKQAAEHLREVHAKRQAPIPVSPAPEQGLTPVEREISTVKGRLAMLRRQTGAYRSLAPTFAISEAALILFAERYTSLARLREVCARAYCAWTMLTNKAEISSADASATIELMETQPQITLEKVLRVVGEFYAISKSDLCSDRRHRSVVHPRQVAMYIAKQVTGRSMHEIGRHTGNRDHSTVINGIKRVIRDMENNPTYKEEVDMLIARLKTM